MNRNTDDGFTILEVLVSLVIVIGSLAAFYRALSVNHNSANVAQREEIATGTADQLLAEIGSRRQLEDGRTEGDTTLGMHWALEIAPLDASRQTDQTTLLRAHQVTVEIWPPQTSTAPPFRFQTVLVDSVAQ